MRWVVWMLWGATAQAADVRDLQPNASFERVVAAARKVGAEAGEACILRRSASGPRLVADLAPSAAATRPPDDWRYALHRGGGAALDGAPVDLGGPKAGMRLAALTPVPPALADTWIPVLVVTRDALWRSLIPGPPAHFAAAMPERLTREGFDRFREDILQRAHGVVVTAEAGVSVRRLASQLAFLGGFDGAVVLATAADVDAPTAPDTPSPVARPLQFFCAGVGR